MFLRNQPLFSIEDKVGSERPGLVPVGFNILFSNGKYIFGQCLRAVVPLKSHLFMDWTGKWGLRDQQLSVDLTDGLLILLFCWVSAIDTDSNCCFKKGA